MLSRVLTHLKLRDVLEYSCDCKYIPFRYLAGKSDLILRKTLTKARILYTLELSRNHSKRIHTTAENLLNRHFSF